MNPKYIDIKAHNPQISYLLDFAHVESNIWDGVKNSLLIENILLGIPIGSIIVDLNPKIILIGNNKINAIKLFLTDEFTLNQLIFIPQYDGYKYSDLPLWLQRKITESYIHVLELRPGIPTEEKNELLKRLHWLMT